MHCASLSCGNYACYTFCRSLMLSLMQPALKLIQVLLRLYNHDMVKIVGTAFPNDCLSPVQWVNLGHTALSVARSRINTEYRGTGRATVNAEFGPAVRKTAEQINRMSLLCTTTHARSTTEF